MNVETEICASCESLRRSSRPLADGYQPFESKRAERGDVRDDDRVPCHAGELPALRVDDRAARPDQVDRAIGLAVGECRVGRAVEDLDRPRTQREEAERDPDDRCESADADEEPGAAEEGSVRARVRLKAAAAGKGARKLALAPGIGAGDGYGGCDRSDDVCGASVGTLPAGRYSSASSSARSASPRQRQASSASAWSAERPS